VLLGLSFWTAGGAAATTGDLAAAHAEQPAAPADPLATHEGVLFGGSLGLAAASIEGCDACELEPGLAVDASLGWFLARRFALEVDSTATVAPFALSSGFGSFGFGLTSLALQYWPHPDVWLKVGIGSALLTSSALGATGFGVETGGGGTFAAGYEFHHDRNFAMDLELRATHGSFHPSDEALEGVDSFVGTVGAHWY
jgi:hypothetical protein